MGFSVNTNIASLQAQDYIRVNSDFQSKTINRVTSGLRIVQSGDDAAGLAIANNMRSDQAVLTQGIRNANDGLSQLQIIDGGMNNISKLLDRARTLATQSASQTFTGDRGVLNDEFQSVITEINRQAKAVGLDQGGDFAKNLSVFVGGGKKHASEAASAVITNGSVSVDLSKSTVDANSLGLKGLQATGVAGKDIGTGSTTSVSKILSNTNNKNSLATEGWTDFYFTGAGFANTTDSASAGNNRVKVSVNLSGVTDAAGLANAVNKAIESAGNSGTQQATAFKNAGIRASVVTDSASNGQRIAFTSSTATFQVAAGDKVANAVMGNFASGEEGQSAKVATAASGTAVTFGAGAQTVTLQVLKGGAAAASYSVAIAGTEGSEADVLTAVNTGLAGSGITASLDGSNNLIFTNDKSAESFEIQAAGDTLNRLGIGGNWSGFGATSVTAGAAVAAGETQDVAISVNGGPARSLGTLSTGATTAATLQNLNDAIQNDETLRNAGVYAYMNGASRVVVASKNGDNIRVSAGTASATTGFGFTEGTVSTTGKQEGTYAGATAPTTYAGGSSNTEVMGFGGIRVGGVTQTLTVSATDTNGTAHSLAITLTSANADTLDHALDHINDKLLESNDDTLKQIVALKERNGGAAATEGVRFTSSLSDFNVVLGTTAVGNESGTTVGIYDDSKSLGNQQGVSVNANDGTGGVTSDIATQTNAESAVSALAAAVSTLGKAQAAVGKGQNAFNYAINLASSQLSNFAASESRIRDADLAQEAANMTKAQITLQAGIAALAQANSAPQAVLSLLRG
jgi:flagellin